MAWGFSTQSGSPATLGAGVTIGIIDTGVDVTYPDLSAKIAGSKRFVTGAVNPTGSDVSDLDGHGTNVAGIARRRKQPEPGLRLLGHGL